MFQVMAGIAIVLAVAFAVTSRPSIAARVGDGR
jgi:hypothetical protein